MDNIYENLSPELEKKINADRINHVINPYAAKDEDAVRRQNRPHDIPDLIRTNYIRDCDKILHCPWYNRYADKTQVFSFVKNDDITRRALHVQLVSRIARTIGSALGLNLQLIEAIALGHDMGHTPFGHSGERILDDLCYSSCNRHFAHNLQSARVLDGVFQLNLSLQTLDGIVCHDGELELKEYKPGGIYTFDEFDQKLDACIKDKSNISSLIPATLEGCVVRVSDIIAYLGKDRQDAERAKLAKSEDFNPGSIGNINAAIIHNLVYNIVENSYMKPYLKMDDEHFESLKQAKRDNYKEIYEKNPNKDEFDAVIRPMMADMYSLFLDDIKQGNENSKIFTHHIRQINYSHYQRLLPYEASTPDQIVVDYIASMTDDYFIDLYNHLFPNSPYKIKYLEYFD